MKYKTSWNFELLVKNFSDKTLEDEQKLIDKKVRTFVKNYSEKDLLSDNALLLEALNSYEKLFVEHGLEGKSGLYLYLKLFLDQSDAQIKGKVNKIDEHSKMLFNELQFFTHRISKATDSQKDLILKDENLKKYHHFLFKLFKEGEYLLSESEEKIITLKSKTSSSNWVQMTQQLLSKEEATIEGNKKAFTEVVSLMDSKNKKTRDNAAQEFNRIMEKWVDVAEIELNSILENKKLDDDLRKIVRADFVRHLSDDVETEVIDVLLESVSSKFEISKRFYELKSKLLGVKKLKYHERNLEIASINKTYSFDESVDLVTKVFGNLDSEFLEIFQSFLKNGEIDVYPKKGKSSGAFCLSDMKSNPIFILLNHTDKLNDVLTLAHEVGHAIHFEMAKEQNSLNFGASLATAEVASTFMEDFVLQEILKEADEEMKLNLLMVKLNDDVSTIFRQVACYKFEQDLHNRFRETGYLSKEEIGNLFTKNMKDYMGDFVNQDSGSENWWVYWSHIRYFFYVYSYASGLLISKSLQSSVQNDPKFVNKIKTYFKAGNSDSAKNIFAEMNIDITDRAFWLKGLGEVEELLAEAESLAKKLGKI